MLTEVYRSRDDKKLARVLEVLKAQQETWQVHPSSEAGRVEKTAFSTAPAPGPNVDVATFAQSVNLGLPAEA